MQVKTVSPSFVVAFTSAPEARNNEGGRELLSNRLEDMDLLEQGL